MTEQDDQWIEFDKWLSNLDWMLREARRFQAIGQPDRAKTYLQHIAWTIQQRLDKEVPGE